MVVAAPLMVIATIFNIMLAKSSSKRALGRKLGPVVFTLRRRGEFGGLAASFTADIHPILPADRESSVAAFGHVVVDRQQTRTQELRKCFPLIERVAERFAQVALGEHVADGLVDPLTHGFHQR